MLRVKERQEEKRLICGQRMANRREKEKVIKGSIGGTGVVKVASERGVEHVMFKEQKKRFEEERESSDIRGKEVQVWL